MTKWRGCLGAEKTGAMEVESGTCMKSNESADYLALYGAAPAREETLRVGRSWIEPRETLNTGDISCRHVDALGAP